MNLFRTGLALAFVLAPLASAQAATMDYRFSFNALFGPDPVAVVGIVRGLQEGTNSVETVEIISNSRGYGIGTYSDPSASFTVTGGNVTAADFSSFGGSSTAPDVTDASLAMYLFADGSGRAGLSPFVSSVDFNSPSEAPAFERIEVTSTVPLPGAAGLLGMAFVALGAARAVSPGRGRA